MAKEEILEFSGTVTELLPNAMWRGVLDNEHEILAHTAGKMRKHRIRVLAECRQAHPVGEAPHGGVGRAGAETCRRRQTRSIPVEGDAQHIP